MSVDLPRALSSKRVDVVILGAPVTPALAAEMIARTDIGFGQLRYGRIDARTRGIRAAVGLPPHVETLPGHLAPDDPQAAAAMAQWRHRWGSLDLIWLANNQLLAGAIGVAGWCHPDGGIAFADEIEDYPMANELHDDCRALATAFPDLAMDVAAWGGHGRSLDMPLIDTPPAPWPDALIAGIHTPRVGFLIGDGNVEIVDGDDPRLFVRFAAGLARAVEAAVESVRRHRDAPDIPDAMIAAWQQRAAFRGLV